MSASAEHRQAARDPWDIGFGVVVLGFALVALFFWFPRDIKGGVFVLNQIGKPEPGDAFFPVILAGLMAVLGAGQLLLALFAPSANAQQGRLTRANGVFMAGFLATVLAGLAIMYWLGPLVVDALGAAGLLDKTYRQLTDTIPYKYIGYVAGGLFMTGLLIVRAEGMIRPRAMLSAVLVIAFLVFVLDGLLYNIQLPPNAEY